MDRDNKLKAIRMWVQAVSALIPQPTLRDDRVSGSNLDLRTQVLGGGWWWLAAVAAAAVS